MVTKTRVLEIGDLRLENAVLLAPLDGYTDLPFRLLCRKLGASMAFTEFTNCQGLATRGASSLGKISIAAHERPVGCQIYGREPKRMAKAARVAQAQSPDVIDLNFGCPARKVGSGGCGSQLMREPGLLFEIVRAVVAEVSLPVTCKLRLGWDASSINVIEVCLRLQDLGVRAVTIHGRTRCQKYRGEASWDWIARVKDALEIPVIGNGDIRTAAEARLRFEQSGVDAVMIGRAAIERPWVFREIRALLDSGRSLPPPSRVERVNWLIELLDDAVVYKGLRRGVRETRKMYATFLRDCEGFEALRRELVRLEELPAIRDRLFRLRDELAWPGETIPAA